LNYKISLNRNRKPISIYLCLVISCLIKRSCVVFSTLYCTSKVSGEESNSNSAERTTIVIETKSVKLKESFEPSPVSKHLESYFLIWNNIDAITCYSEQSQRLK